MPETFRWNMQLLQGKTYAERAKECRRVAKLCPEYLKKSYLEMAAEYEQLANETKEVCLGAEPRRFGTTSTAPARPHRPRAFP